MAVVLGGGEYWVLRREVMSVLLPAVSLRLLLVY